jgi:hypothetical protein
VLESARLRRILAGRPRLEDELVAATDPSRPNAAIV